jgi:hypothetical protein
MNRQDQLQLRSESLALRQMIADIPEQNVLDRGSLISRLEEIDQTLAGTAVDERNPLRARLTFNGRPVVGTYGIFADFGAKAVNYFNEAIAAVSASLAGGLAAKGPIPHRDIHQLLITNAAFGSFGFELEEYRTAPLPNEEQTTLELAIERTQNLLQGSVNRDDDFLADSAAELDQRAIDKVRDFVGILAENEAVCALQVRDRVFRFTDVGQVRRSLERISPENLHEEEQTLQGEFQGILPKRRTFEFYVRDTQDVIVGKAATAVGDADAINEHLHQATRIQVLVTRVGSGRPRYRLLAMPEWKSGPPSDEAADH